VALRTCPTSTPTRIDAACPLTAGEIGASPRQERRQAPVVDQAADVFFLRYLDVCLVLATAPFVLVSGLPTFGYLVGAAAWLLTRLGTAYVQERARRVADVRLRTGLLLAGMMARVWIVALAVILARYAGSTDDGIMAAGLVLAAFTVYFVMSLVTRGGALQGRPDAHGRPSPS
jgi:hypothetical protein